MPCCGTQPWSFDIGFGTHLAHPFFPFLFSVSFLVGVSSLISGLVGLYLSVDKTISFCCLNLDGGRALGGFGRMDWHLESFGWMGLEMDPRAIPACVRSVRFGPVWVGVGLLGL